MERRKVMVPFRGAKVPVYLVYSREVAENGATLDVFVALDVYMNEVVGDSCESTVDLTTLADYRELCQGQGQCIDWRDLSRVGWGLRRKDGGKNVESLLTVFFAQCMMRGFLHRLVTTEMDVVEQAAAGRVYWKPKVEAMRREVEAYKNAVAETGTAHFVMTQIKAMWRRVLDKLDPENKQALQAALTQKTGRVLALHDELME